MSNKSHKIFRAMAEQIPGVLNYGSIVSVYPTDHFLMILQFVKTQGSDPAKDRDSDRSQQEP